MLFFWSAVPINQPRFQDFFPVFEEGMVRFLSLSSRFERRGDKESLGTRLTINYKSTISINDKHENLRAELGIRDNRTSGGVILEKKPRLSQPAKTCSKSAK